jgi:DNA-binding response OmpR family regulator
LQGPPDFSSLPAVRLLLIEDNQRLAALIQSGLTKEGFGADVVASVAEGLSALSTTHFSLVILDLGLPDGDGLSVLQFLRGRGMATPVLVLTARQSTSEKVKGLDHGADDYLGKPFAFDELIARIRALLRRPAAYLGHQLVLRNLAFDTASGELMVDGARRLLPAREAALLEALLRRSNHVVPKTVLEDHLYGLAEEGSANAIEVYIHRLRKQLEDAGAQARIHTVRGVGYLIREQP